MGRSGSGVLADLLRQHPDVKWDAEILSPFRLRSQLKAPLLRVRLLLSPSRRPREVLGLVQRRLRRAPHDKVFGFEIKFFHLELESIPLSTFLDVVRSELVDRFIVLERRNKLRCLVSILVRRVTGVPHTKTRPLTPTSITVDVERVGIERTVKPLVEHLIHWENGFANLRALLKGHPTLELEYERDLEHDPTEAYRRVCEFFSLAPAPVQVRLQRTNPWPLEKIVRNLEDVRAHLAGTPFAWMVDG